VGRLRIVPVVCSRGWPNTDERAARDQKESALQRLFSAFPGSGPGVGLLLLRLVIGATAIAQGSRYFADPATVPLATWALGLTAVLSGALLVVGLLTPCASVLVVVGSLATAQPWFPGVTQVAGGDPIAAVIVALVSAAIVPLGPGAFSVDARLFGRREIVIRQEPRA
jgi:uncharacterized membrane protein YphA (DoxX/SURF4 family)